LATNRSAGDQAAKDRAALGQVADFVLEILISSRNITVPAVSGDQTLTVPDIQATAIRLKDAVILGQAAASDVLGKDVQAGRMVSTYSGQDITEEMTPIKREVIADSPVMRGVLSFVKKDVGLDFFRQRNVFKIISHQRKMLQPDTARFAEFLQQRIKLAVITFSSPVFHRCGQQFEALISIELRKQFLQKMCPFSLDGGKVES